MMSSQLSSNQKLVLGSIISLQRRFNWEESSEKASEMMIQFRGKKTSFLDQAFMR